MFVVLLFALAKIPHGIRITKSKGNSYYAGKYAISPCNSDSKLCYSFGERRPLNDVIFQWFPPSRSKVMWTFLFCCCRWCVCTTSRSIPGKLHTYFLPSEWKSPTSEQILFNRYRIHTFKCPSSCMAPYIFCRSLLLLSWDVDRYKQVKFGKATEETNWMQSQEWSKWGGDCYVWNK